MSYESDRTSTFNISSIFLLPQIIKFRNVSVGFSYLISIVSAYLNLTKLIYTSEKANRNLCHSFGVLIWMGSSRPTDRILFGRMGVLHADPKFRHDATGKVSCTKVFQTTHVCFPLCTGCSKYHQYDVIWYFFSVFRTKTNNYNETEAKKFELFCGLSGPF